MTKIIQRWGCVDCGREWGEVKLLGSWDNGIAMAVSGDESRACRTVCKYDCKNTRLLASMSLIHTDGALVVFEEVPDFGRSCAI